MDMGLASAIPLYIDNIISQKITRTYPDFIVVQYLKRESLFYYFVINQEKKIYLNKILKLFRYSSNYGVEPEEIELSQYNINKSIFDIDASSFKEIEKKVEEDNADSIWNFKINPNSEKIIPILTKGVN